MKILKNKKVVLASAIILGISAITSSALAAYIITGGTTHGEGTITPTQVVVKNNIVNLEVGKMNGELKFYPEELVESGRVITTSDTGSLSVTFPLTMKANAEFEKTDIPELKVTVTETSGSLVTETYVVAPTVENITSDDWKGTSASFTHDLVLTWKWGEKFDSKDPAEYYNTGGGASLDASAVVTAMGTFQTAVTKSVFTVTIDKADATA